MSCDGFISRVDYIIDGKKCFTYLGIFNDPYEALLVRDSAAVFLGFNRNKLNNPDILTVGCPPAVLAEIFKKRDR
jgi:hypothetical protein